MLLSSATGGPAYCTIMVSNCMLHVVLLVVTFGGVVYILAADLDLLMLLL